MAKKTKTKAAKSAPKGKYAQVTIKRLKLADLEEAPYNSRMITAEALAGLASSLEQFGLLSLPVVNKREGGYRIVGGHQRAKVLQQQGETYAHCIVVEFDEDTERRANFTLNNTAIQGQFIPELTKDLLEQIRARMGDTKDSLFRKLRFDKLVQQVTKAIGSLPSSAATISSGKTADDVDISVSRTTAVSAIGGFYKLGDHVLHCGALKARGSLKGFPVDSAHMAITRIAEQKELNREYLEAHLGHILDNTLGAVYIVTNFESIAQVQGKLTDMQGHWSSTLMWCDYKAKPDGDTPYVGAIIPVLYGWPEGERHQFFGGKRGGNVFTLQRAPKKTDMPVEIAVKAMMNSCEKGHYVLDPDVGRGATVIAAEKCSRRLIGYARSTSMCDAVRKRWAEFVHGKDAKWQAKTPEMS